MVDTHVVFQPPGRVAPQFSAASWPDLPSILEDRNLSTSIEMLLAGTVEADLPITMIEM